MKIKNPNQCLICGKIFDHYLEGTKGLCGRCVLKGLPESVRVAIDPKDGSVYYHEKNFFDEIDMEVKRDERERREEEEQRGRNAIVKIRDRIDNPGLSRPDKESVIRTAEQLRVSLR